MAPWRRCLSAFRNVKSLPSGKLSFPIKISSHFLGGQTCLQGSVWQWNGSAEEAAAKSLQHPSFQVIAIHGECLVDLLSVLPAAPSI